MATEFNPVKSADRALEVLEVVAAKDGDLNAAGIGAIMGVPKSSLHAILQTMAHRAWLTIDPVTGFVMLGPRALLLKDAEVPVADLGRLAGPTLDRLSEVTGETVHLGVLEGRDVVFVAKRESVHPIRLHSAVGRSAPAHMNAIGKALLSVRSDAELIRLLPRRLEPDTENTITSRDELLRHLEQGRKRGYTTEDEENGLGVACIAIPLRTMPAAISVAFPKFRLNEQACAATIEALAAVEI